MIDNDASSADPFGAIADEFVEAIRQGQRPTVEEFARRYPEHANEIREILPTLILMEKAKAPDNPKGQRGQVGGSASEPPLRQLGDFQILREVGRGGMGIVYEAEQLSLGRHVAIKVLLAHARLDERKLGRFQREARSAAKLHHTNIVPVFGVGEQDGLHYFVMQFIHGLGLDVVLDELRRLRLPHATSADSTIAASGVSAVVVARVLLSGDYTASGEASAPRSENRTGGLTPPRSPDSSSNIRWPGQSESSALSDSGRRYWQSVARVGMQVADALAYAASQGVLHRDIKPSNLLLDGTGNVWVTDFGLAKADNDSDNLTQTGDVVGTLRYMAPERFDGQGDVRSDVYSLGLTLYELLTMRPAFEETERNKLIKQVMHDEPIRPRKLNRSVPRDLETVILKAIARDPAHRYQTPAEMAEDLKRFVDDRPIRARRVSEAEKLWRWCRRNPLPASLLAGIVLVFLAGFAGVFWQWRVAKTLSEIAELREQEAQQKTRDEARARAEAQRFAAGLLLERGMGLCQQGQYAGGLLWLTRGLDLVPEEADDLRDSIRTQISGWSTRLCPCRLIIDHPHGVKGADLSADGRLVATASGDTAQVWDARTGQPIGPPLKHTARIRAVALSPDGRLLLTGGEDRVAHLWETATGLPVGPPLAHGRAVEHVAFSPDGKAFATGSGHSVERDGHMVGVGEARIWDIASGEVIVTGPRQARDILAVAFTPDGRTLITASKDGTVRSWDTATGAAIGGVIRHNGWVTSLALTADGRAVLTGSHDRTGQLWSMPDGAALTPPLRHTDSVKGVAISPDGRLMLTAGEDAIAQPWEARRGQPVGEPLRAPAAIETAAFSPTGRAFVTGDLKGGLVLWRVPVPVGGDVERLRLWIETAAGTELDATGALRPLTREVWNERRRRLEQLGGPPPGIED